MRKAQYGNLARFAKSSHSRTSDRSAHIGSYDIHMPERSFMRSSLFDQQEDIKTQIIEAAHLGASRPANDHHNSHQIADALIGLVYHNLTVDGLPYSTISRKFRHYDQVPQASSQRCSS